MIVVREASSTRKMSGIATNPSTRVASRGLTCLRLLLVSVLGTLALAASAQAPSVARADETTSSEQAPPPAGGEQAPPAEASTPAEAPPEETTPPSEEAKPPAEETTPPEEKAPVDELPPEETTPPVEETKPPAEETKPPEEPKPAEEPPPPPAEEKAPPAEETKLAEETQSGESKEKLAAGTEGNHEQPLTPVGEAAQERPAEGATSATVEGAGVPTGNLAPPPIAGEPGEVSPSAVLGAVALATHHTSGLGCTLSALEGASNCAAGWVEVKSLLSGTSEDSPGWRRQRPRGRLPRPALRSVKNVATAAPRAAGRSAPPPVPLRAELRAARPPAAPAPRHRPSSLFRGCCICRPRAQCAVCGCRAGRG